MSSPRGDGDDVPDPYYGGDQGFEQVYQMVWRACSALLEELKEELEA
jgi:protein-tyrosine-phosphatase